MQKLRLRTLAASLALTVGLGCFSATAAMAEDDLAAEREMPSYESVVEALDRADDYWQKTYGYTATPQQNYHPSFWFNAAYHSGNMEAYYVTGNEKYREYSTDWANYNGWMGNSNTDREKWGWNYNQNYGQAANLFGDWQACFQTYIDLYNSERMEERTDGDGAKLAASKDTIDYQMTVDPSHPRYSGDAPGYWWWADALYMVPPVFTKLYATTGDIAYLDKLYEYYRYAAELMYDGECGIPVEGEEYTTAAKLNDGAFPSDAADFKHLFYRDARYVYPLSQNPGHEDEKNFWARGNGWVFAGLAKILPDIPESHESYDYLKNIYLQMAEAIKDCQCQDPDGNGFWTQSMLQNYPTDESNPYGYETSGTAFFTYGLAWGLNSGLLDGAEYLQPTLRAWKYLSEVALQYDGRVGYCQTVNSEATTPAAWNSNQAFGYGAFLLAASEMSRLAGGVQGDVVDGRANGDIYPYLLHKMVGKTAFEVNSPHLFKDGSILHIDDGDLGSVPYVDGGEVYLPEAAVEKLGLDGAAADDGGYVSGEQLTAAGYSLWAFPYEGENGHLGDLYVISRTSKFFYDCDKNVVEMLRSMIGGIERYPVRPNKKEAAEGPELPYGEELGLSEEMLAVSEGGEPEAGNGIGNVTDRDYGTVWAAPKGAALTLDLGTEYPVSCVGINIKRYDDARLVYYKWQYSLDNDAFTDALSGDEASVPGGGKWEYTDLMGETARYIRLVTGGNSRSDWASVAEVSVYTGEPDESVKPVKMEITGDMYSASAEPEPQNGISNAFDGDPETYWAVDSYNYLNIDLGGLKRVAYVTLTLRDYEDGRSLKYRVEHGATFAEDFRVDFDGQSSTSGDGKTVARHAVEDEAKYITIVPNGSTSGDWFSLCEVGVYVYPESEAEIQGTAPTVSAELNYVYDKDIVENTDEYNTVNDNDLAILFTYDNLPARASIQIRSGDGSNDKIIFEEEPDKSGSITVVPRRGDSNRIYRASIIANTGEVLAVTDASLYSVVTEHLNKYAATDYAGDGVKLNRELLDNIVRVLNMGGVYLTESGALVHEASLIMDKEMGENKFTIKPELVKMGLAFYYDGVGDGRGTGVKYNTYDFYNAGSFGDHATADEIGYYDVLTISAGRNEAVLSRSAEFESLFPGDMGGAPEAVTVDLSAVETEGTVIEEEDEL